MARISTYQVDTNVTGADIWIGTDGNDNKKTKNFSPNILAQYLNENEVISTANSLRYRYDTIASGDSRKTGTISFQTEIGANVAFSSITTFILSNKTLGSTTVDAFLNILPNTRILIQNSSNINFFGIYFVNSVTPHLTETGYYVVNLTYVSGNGNLSEDMDYLIHLIEYKTVIPATPTLQIVTNAGDTTTTTVHLDGGASSDSVNEQAIFNPDQIASINKTTGSGVSIDSIGNVSLSNGVDSSILSSANVTNPNVVLQFPNKISGDYTLATTDDIPPVTGFVPYTGATEDVNLGEFGLLTGNIEFDNTPTNVPTTAGAMYWNDSDGTADLILKGGNVKLQVGQESVIRVVNKTATNINLLEANYQAVRVTGAQGQRLKVDLAQATTDNLSAETIGLVTETINNNQEGFITTSGLVRNINTTGSLQGETWADGDILYLSPTTAGRVTKVKPVAPNHLVIIGYVVHAHANQGSIFVKVDNGYELDELHNVKITSAANNNVLAYTSATDIWENKTVETALGYTPENVANKSTSTSLGTSNTLYPTQNAVKVYADTKFTLPTLTSGSVLFSNGSTIAQDNANLFWDDTNNRLGIRRTPSVELDVSGDIRSTGTMFNTTTQTNTVQTNGSNLSFKGSGSTTYATMFLSTGNFVLQNSGTFTDAGYKLDVNGTARVSGNATFGTLGTGTGMFWDNTNNRLGIGTASPSTKLEVSNGVLTVTNGSLGTGQQDMIYFASANFPTSYRNKITSRMSSNININNISIDVGTGDGTSFVTPIIAFGNGRVIMNAGNVGIGTTTDAGFRLDVNGTARVQGNFTLGGTTAIGGGYGVASGTFNIIQNGPNVVPSSGNMVVNGFVYSGTINQTGGANGITRGLYINPTLTAAADFRAIEVANGITILGASTTAKASLRIPSGTAPTTPTNGDIWFDGTDLKMRIGGVTKTFTLI